MKWSEDVGKGWRPIVDKAVSEIEGLGGRIGQVKEKFGGLRIYIDHIESDDAYDKIHQILRTAEGEAEKTCEGCGKPGQPKEINGWLKTVCPDHEQGFKWE